MNKLITFFCVVFFLIETSDSFAQQIKSIIVSKDNKIDQRDYLQNQENCIYLCSINELNSFKETLESNLKSDQNIFLIQLNDISTFSIHNTDLVNAIVFKLPYELSSSIIQRWIPVGWSINKVENSTDFIYAVQRSANGQCSKEEKILLFQEMFLKSLDLIEKSKNSNEYTLYLNQQLSTFNEQLSTLPFFIVCDDADFVSKTLNNFLWVTFTRCNPSHDVYGLNSVTKYKHWGCSTLIFDARIKPHHAPPVLKDEAVEKRIDKIFEKGGSLYSVF